MGGLHGPAEAEQPKRRSRRPEPASISLFEWAPEREQEAELAGPREAVAALKLLVAPPKRDEKDVVEVKVVKVPAQTEVLRTHGVAPEEEEKRRTAILESGLIEEEWG